MAALRARRRDEGLTLIELLVTMMLLAVVSTLVVTAVAQTVRVLTHTQDEAAGLADAKVILDRLGRDIREARGVVCLPDPDDPTCNAHLQLWIDSNSDYAQQPEEIVTWRLLDNLDGVHYDVWRYVGPEGAYVSEQRQASSLIVRIAFCYDDSNPCTQGYFPEVEQIRIRMQYDALLGRGTELRDVAFSVRLRNK
jgi:prepilin-type N-terminal cleavage/methylation domain-containing protein